MKQPWAHILERNNIVSLTEGKHTGDWYFAGNHDIKQTGDL